MSTLIVFHPDFHSTWPFAANPLHALFESQGPAQLIRLADQDRRPLGQLTPQPKGVTRLIALGVPVTAACLAHFGELCEASFQGAYSRSVDHGDLLAA